MKQLVLTGLGNEMDLKTGRSLFTAIFNGSIRIEISEEAAKELTTAIYGASASSVEVVDDYSRPPTKEEEAEQFGGDVSSMSLRDEPDSVYDQDTGVAQV